MRRQIPLSGSPLAGLLIWAMLLLAACGPHRKAWVHPAYENEDQRQTLRLGVTTSPAPGGDAVMAELWTALARQYANQHRDFIARGFSMEGMEEPSSHCGTGHEAILHIEPTRVDATARGYALALSARMVRCRDGAVIWKATARGRFKSQDPHLVEVKARYEALFGDEIGPVVAPSFRLIRAALSNLPRPVLETDDDIMEKILLGE